MDEMIFASTQHLSLVNMLQAGSEDRMAQVGRDAATAAPVTAGSSGRPGSLISAPVRGRSAPLGPSATSMSTKSSAVRKSACSARRFPEVKLRKNYEKPSEARAWEKAGAVWRSRRAAGSQAIREGPIAAPKPRPGATARGRQGAGRQIHPGMSIRTTTSSRYATPVQLKQALFAEGYDRKQLAGAAPGRQLTALFKATAPV